MAFYQSKDELRKYVSTNADVSDERLKPLESAVILKHFRPWMGQPLLDYFALLGASIDPDEAKALDIFKNAFYNLLLFEYVPFGEVQIGNGGITRTDNDKVKTAFAGQIENLNASLEEIGQLLIEDLIELMYAVPDTFVLWQNAPGYNLNEDLLIRTVKAFTIIQPLDRPHITFMRIVPTMRIVQDQQIRASFPDTLLNELMTDDGNLNLPKRTVKQYICRALVCFTMAKVVRDGVLRITPTGAQLVEHANDGSTRKIAKQLTPVDMAMKISEKTEDGYRYIDQAQQYMSDYSAFFGSQSEDTPRKNWWA